MRRYSQHFLRHSKVSQQFVDSLSCPHFLWEIGPGKGALTRHALDLNVTFKAFEIDPSMCLILRERYPQLELYEGDFLKVDLSKHIKEGQTIDVISNLPYAASSPILFKLIEMHTHIGEMIFSFQQEYAERLVAKVNTSDYGILSVLMQYAFKMRKIFEIPPNFFYPPPKVNSWVLLFEPQLDFCFETFGHLQKLVHAAFQQRRKKMINNLKKVYQADQVLASFDQLKISENARAQECTLDQYLLLVNELRFKA